MIRSTVFPESQFQEEATSSSEVLEAELFISPVFVLSLVLFSIITIGIIGTWIIIFHALFGDCCKRKWRRYRRRQKRHQQMTAADDMTCPHQPPCQGRVLFNSVSSFNDSDNDCQFDEEEELERYRTLQSILPQRTSHSSHSSNTGFSNNSNNNNISCNNRNTISELIASSALLVMPLQDTPPKSNGEIKLKKNPTIAIVSDETDFAGSEEDVAFV